MSSHNQILCEICLQSEDYGEVAHTCVHESMGKNKLWLAKYRINDWPRWDDSMDEATLTFSQDGLAKVVCEMQVIGSSQGESWQWSWGNTKTPDACREKMHAVQSLGKERHWEQRTTLFLPCDEYTGWEYASISSHILNGIGAYRCPYEGGAVSLVILSSQFVL